MILGIGGEAGLMTQDVAYRQFRFPCLVRLKARIFITVVGDIDRIIHKLLSDQVNDLRIKIKVLVTHQILQRIVDGIHLRIRCQIIERIVGDSGAVALAGAVLIVGVDSSPGLLKNELSIFYDSQLRAGKAMFNILLNDLVDQINRFETLQAKQTALQKERAERERKGDTLDAFLFELSELDELDMEFSPQRWNAIVDHVTVHHDGRIVFSFQNGCEVIVEIV